MAHKELKYDSDARKALELGVDAVANAVKVTLGPRGRYVVLDKKFGAPNLTNAGVTLARAIAGVGEGGGGGALKVTLGPRGRYVVLDKKFGAPTITNDGVTIAREIEVEDVFQNQGAQLAREGATATNDVAGDGTTTATVLAQSMVHEGMRNVAAGANPMALKR